MATLTSSLILSLVDRVTAPARAAARSVAGLRASAARNAQQMNAMQGQMLGAVAGAVALASAIRSPVRAAMEFESAMADVRKVVDFDTPEGFRRMADNIIAMTRTIPMAATEISAIVAAAGQAGMQGAELLAFAEMAAKVGVAFDISANQAGDSLAKIKTALGMTVADVSSLSDAINHLSNTSASSAPDLLNFMERVGSVGKQYGFTAEQTAALGSAMIAAGAPAEVAATSFRNVGRALARGASATPRVSAAFEQLGLDAEQVAKRLNKDAVGTLNDVIERIRSLPKHVQASTISDLFGDEARAIMPLIENAGLLEGALVSVADQASYAGSAQQEFEVRARTTANTLQLLQNHVKEAAIRIGTALLPAVESTSRALMPVLAAIAEWVKANPALTAQIIGLVSTLVGLRIATLAARWAFLFLKGGVLDAAIAVGRSASLMMAAGTKIAETTRMVRRFGLSMTLLSATGGTGFFASLVAGASAAGSAIATAAAAIGAAIAGITAPIWGVIAAVAALALVVYNYWTPISEFVTGFASVVGSALSEAVSAIAGAGAQIASAVAGWASSRIVNLGALLGFDPATVRSAVDAAAASINAGGAAVIAAVKAIPAALAGWVRGIFTINQYTEQATGEFRSAGERVGQALVDGIKTAFDALWAWLKSLPSKIIAAIGRIDLSGLIKWPSLPRWLGGGAPNPANDNAAIAGTRAAGGAIAGGRTYLVGEDGPELVTPSRSGYVHDADATSSMMSRRGGVMPGGGSQTVNMGGITIQVVAQPGMDPQAIARAVNEALGKIAGDSLSGGQFDQEWSVA
ncbi:phage tail tape measure protein [uncultured Hoeflea sp.]|uniref:phage tail tape measure protein n=1 Tax=uncultured Hoeflea sp. TaxID=538666 RepID=UPI0030DA86AC